MLPRTLIQSVVEGQRQDIEANISGALHVVMAAEDIGAHAGAANVARQQEQHAARPHVRGADRVLGLAHAPDQCRRLVIREHLGDTFELFAGNTGNAFNFFRSPFFHFLARIFIAVNTLPDEILVLPAVLDDVPHDPVQHRDIGSGRRRTYAVACAAVRVRRGSMTITLALCISAPSIRCCIETGWASAGLPPMMSWVLALRMSEVLLVIAP